MESSMIRETSNPANLKGLKPHGQKGFTLIELIMVIVILGILSAFALPRFADFTGDAESSSIEAALGGVKSGSAIAHAADLAGGSTGTVALEGTNFTLVNSYPDRDDLDDIAGLDGFGLKVDVASQVTVFIGGTTIANGDLCFTFIESAGSNAAPTFAPTSGTGSWDTSVTPAVCN